MRSNTSNKNSMSENRIRRLPVYFRYLRELLMNGVMKISSKELAEKLGITPSQVRSDLNCFEGTGQQGYGYNVKLLYTEISRVLGAGDKMNAVIIGGDIHFAKHLSERFEGRGVTVYALFSEDSSSDLSFLSCKYSDIVRVLSEHPAEIAVIVELPKEISSDILISLGIKGIWNLTNRDISASIPIINLPVGDIIMNLCYEIRNYNAEGKNEL